MENKRFKEGDFVRTKSTHEILSLTRYDLFGRPVSDTGIVFTTEMREYTGKVCRIREVHHDLYRLIGGDSWSWAPEWVDDDITLYDILSARELVLFELGDKVTFRPLSEILETNPYNTEPGFNKPMETIVQKGGIFSIAEIISNESICYKLKSDTRRVPFIWRSDWLRKSYVEE